MPVTTLYSTSHPKVLHNNYSLSSVGTRIRTCSNIRTDHVQPDHVRTDHIRTDIIFYKQDFSTGGEDRECNRI